MDEARWRAQQVGRAGVGDPPTARRKNHGWCEDKFFGYCNFQIPELHFATFGEEPRDGHSGPLFDLGIEVKKGSAKLLRQRPPDGRFAGARQSDED